MRRVARVLRFGTVFSNAGYMSLPLQQALLGEEGVFYGAAYVAVFNLIVWSCGVLEMSGDRKNLSVKKLVLNPGMIGLAFGLPIFLFSIPLPEVIAAPVSHLAALNTPLPMIIVGVYLADTKLMSIWKDARCYLAAGLRLLVIPLATLVVLLLCGVRGTLADRLRDRGKRSLCGGDHDVCHPISAGYRPVGESGFHDHPVVGGDDAAGGGAESGARRINYHIKKRPRRAVLG